MKRFLNQLLTLVFGTVLAVNINAQCVYTSAFGSATFGTCGGAITATTCNFAGEYATFSGLIAGNQYQFASVGGPGTNFLTITTAANVVLASGPSPLTWTSTLTGTVRLHIAASPACGTDFTCRTTTGNCISCSPPVQVLCPAATPIPTIPIAGGTSSVTGNTACSAPAQAVPTCGTTLNSANGIWHTYTPSCGGTIELNTCTGTTYDSKIGVFTGSCTALTCVVGNDDACGLQSRVTFAVTGGTTYYVYVTGFGTGNGAYTLTAVFTPDVCTCTNNPLSAEFQPADITVCPYEPFTGSLVITGGIPGPPSGLGVAHWSTAPAGATTGTVGLTNGNNGSPAGTLSGVVGTTPFRGGGAVVKSTPSTDPPNLTDPFYYVSTPNFYRFQNGVETLISSNLPANAACNAWDRTTNTMYFATAGAPGTLSTININTGALTTIGNFNGGGVAGFAIWLEFDDAGNLYMFDIANDNVYRVNKTNAACTLLGPAGFNGNFGQDAFFWNGAIYSHAFNAGTFSMQYRRFDITTGASTLITDLGFAQSGAESWYGQTFPGGYDVQWNFTTGLTETGPSWSTFDGLLINPGVYNYVVTVTDACGNTATAQFNVTVRDIPEAMSCNDHVNISVEESCSIDLRADMFLEGPYDGCYDLYELYIWPYGQEAVSTGNVNRQTVSFRGLFGTHTYVVVNPFTGNRCWGTFTVEDKYAPVVECEDFEISCLQSSLLDLPINDPNFLGLPNVIDNCDDAVLSFNDLEVGSDVCTKVILRRWSAVDGSDNVSAECIQQIVVNPISFADVFIPNPLVVVECNTDTDPASIVAATGDVRNGFPFVNLGAAGFLPVDGQLCNIVCTYTDQLIDACGPHCHGNKKVIRTWQCIDWCEGIVSTPFTQLIKSADLQGPTFILKDTTVTTSPWYCAADFDLPRPWELHDNCDINPTYYVSGPGIVQISGNPVAGYRAKGAPKGVHTFCYTATDCCGNLTTLCMRVTVVDRTPPVPVTYHDIVVGLVPGGPGQDGNAKLFTEHINNNSYDNCTDVRVEIRRPAGSPKCNNEGRIINPLTGETYNNNVTFNNNVPRLHADDNANDTDGGQFVKFCCEDLTTGVDIDGDGEVNIGYHEVIMRVWDDGDMNAVWGSIGDNYNESWIYVKVEDKAPPVIQCPPNMTIFCDWAITYSTDLGSGAQPTEGVDFTKTGLPVGYGTCGTLPIRFRDNIGQLNQCKLGNVTRDFFVGSAPVNQAPSCRQIITILPSTSQQPWVITPPTATPVATTCDGPTDAQIEANGPRWVNGPCDVIGENIKVHEFLFEDGVCKKWRVEYNYMNWCTNESRGPFFKDFMYFDQVKPVIENCDPLMFGVDANCSHRLVLTNTATDEGGCIEEGWLKWQVFVDLWADGTDDWEFSSFLPVNNDVANANNGNLAAIRDDNNNGVPDIYVAPTLNGGQITITIPELIVGKMSNHKVSWKVTDGCHNHTTCHQDVMVADKKAPTPYCINLSTALMEDPDGSGPLRPMVELWAIDFNIGSFDNCTPQEDLLFTFDSWAPQVTDTVIAGRLINIDVPHYFDANGGVMGYPTTNAQVLSRYNNGELQLWLPSLRSSAKVWTDAVLTGGTNKAEVDVMMSVWDKKFNVDFCWVKLAIICNTCPTNGGGSRIAGITSTESGQGVNNVTVSLDRNAPEFPVAAQTVNGMFSFEGIDNSANTNDKVRLFANKGGDYDNGVSTLDLVLIQRHILGTQEFTNAMNVIAADVNNDARINSVDLVELRKVILGTADEFTNKSWRFPVAGQTLDVTNVFPYNENISLFVSGDVDNQNFVAVKIGDVNGTATTDVMNATAESRTASSLNLTAENRNVEAGETVEVPVTAANFNDVFGFQYTMNLEGASFVNVIPGTIEINESNVGVISNEMITMSFASATAETRRADDVLFTIVLKANKAAQLSEMMYINSNVTSAESYVGSNIRVQNIGLTVGSESASADIQLFQNEPNPFKGQTKVSFFMPKANNATLTVYDVTGRVINIRNIDAVQGVNTEVYNREQLGTSGMLYYKLESGDFTATKKMIIIE
jgi:hypothetical protein